jgi:UDP-galactopyranose mutase
MTKADYIIVGSGLTGSTIARLLADEGREVLILERRNHFGGNVHDSKHPSGVRIHTYGPHYFRCSSPRIWDYVERFAKFYNYEAHISSEVNGRLEEWPVNRELFEHYVGWERLRPRGTAKNFEDACLQKMPKAIYEAFVEGYTRRQWGTAPNQLGVDLARRIRINGHTQRGLTPHARIQGLPREGYAAWMSTMIAGISCQLGVDYLTSRENYLARKALIFTGPIDEYFGFDLGRLTYRSQRRRHDYLPGTQEYQPCVQINHPGAVDSDPIRTVEWKHLMLPEEQLHVKGTVITQEYPFTAANPNEYEYPFPDEANRRLYQQYEARAKTVPNLIVCGRLGEYRYFDMDQAIGRAMTMADKLLGKRTGREAPNGRRISFGRRASAPGLLKRGDDLGI